MIYREIGKTGMKASIVGFGGMRFFEKDEETAHATIHSCLNSGINFFETGAYGQGKSEEWLGNALKGHCKREDIILSNKTTIGSFPNADAVRKNLEKSLVREQTEYFDFYNFWGVNDNDQYNHIFKEDGPLSAVMKAKEEGLIKAIGITTHAKPDLILEFCDRHPWDMVILKEHMLYSRNQDVIRLLGKKGIGVVAMTPLAGGVLAMPSEEMKKHLSESDLTMPVLALRYLVSNPCMTSVISGMASPEEVKENGLAGLVDAPLSEAESDCVDFIRERISSLGDKFCTSCGYCMPCPNDVNIPAIFRLWNILRGYGANAYTKLEYKKMLDQNPWADFSGSAADACIECEECLEKCPEKLPIIEDLKKAHADLT